MRMIFAGRVVRVNGTVAKVRVGSRFRGKQRTAFFYTDFRACARTPRVGERVCGVVEVDALGVEPLV